jgi:hypothetical protein
MSPVSPAYGGGGGGSGGGGGGGGGSAPGGGGSSVNTGSNPVGFTPADPIVHGPSYSAPAPDGAVVTVRIQIDQNAVISRNAFTAGLSLSNSAASPISNLLVTLNPLDANEQPAPTAFFIQAPSLNGLNAVDGTGSLAAAASGQASWIIIPTTNAAPNGATQYSIGGTLAYVIAGQQVTIPLYSYPITVLPDPRLSVDYFLQHDIYGDDPFTTQIEPSIPAGLGIIVRNSGLGTANDFTITSAQPTIITNANGLAVAFNLIGSEVGRQSETPSLTLDFGNIVPGGDSVGLWYLTSTLEGEFINYSATFQHVDALGGTSTSLIDSVRIHEMNHVVRITLPADDGIPDFLVNDTTNVDAPPDNVYSSDGSVFPVTSVTSGNTATLAASGVATVTVANPLPSGWVYLEVPDPTGGNATITGVQRADGSPLLVGPNVWQTPYRPHMVPPQLNNLIHIFDYNPTGSYTVNYGASNITIVATGYNMEVAEGQSGQLPVPKLIHAATVPAGTTLTASLPSPTSVLGGTLQLINNQIIYTPPVGIVGTINTFTDNFTYTLTAASGASATGTVAVTVTIPTGSGQSVTGVSVANGQATISFVGIPGFLYDVESSSDLINWTVIGTATAGPSGLFQFVDVNAGQYTTRFYRDSAP